MHALELTGKPIKAFPVLPPQNNQLLSSATKGV